MYVMLTYGRRNEPAAAAVLDMSPDQYRLASLRYDLSKLRAKHLVEKVAHSRRYRLLPAGYRNRLDRLYQQIAADLDAPPRSRLRLAACDSGLKTHHS